MRDGFGMIRALFFDLDGTLLTSGRRISPGTLAALDECHRRGIRVFVATARPPLLQGMLGLTPAEARAIADGGVFYNGGCILCEGRREYTVIDAGAVQQCLEALDRYPQVNVAIQMRAELHAFRFPLPETQLTLWGVESTALLPLGAEAANSQGAVKMVVFSPVEVLPELRRELGEALAGGAGVYLTGRPGGFQALEIIAKEANKRLAADRILSWCGIGADEVAVFGDDTNDIDSRLAGDRVLRSLYAIELSWKNSVSSEPGTPI
jgi:hydroxymethylpyrimidine pyrophosphatase-like HAD family hydrolase